MRFTTALTLSLFFTTSFLLAKEENNYPLLAGKPEEVSKQEIYSHFLKATLLERQGRLERALKEYNQTLELEPGASWVLNQRANLHLKMGNPEKAIEDALKYTQVHPKDPQAHFLVANIHLSLNQKMMARSALEKALAEDPNHDESLLLLGQLLIDEDPNHALQILTRLVKIHPGSVEGYYALGFCYQKIGKITEAKSAFQKVIELDVNSLQSLMLLGTLSENDKKIDDAIYYFEKAFSRSTGSLSLCLQLVKLYHQKNEYEKIISLIGRFLNETSSNTELEAWMGLAYEQTKQNKKALFHYEQAARHSKNPEIYLHLASLYSQERDHKNMIQSLKTLNNKFPNEPQFIYLLGLSYLDQKDLNKAIPQFEKVIKLDSNNGSALFQLGVAYDTLEKWSLAEKYFRKVIQLDPKNASSYNYLGYTYADRFENLKEARSLLTKAIEIEPENPAFLDSLGWLQYKEKNYSQALINLEKSAKSLPDSTVFYHLGDCYLALQEFSKAALIYERSLELDPKNKEVRKKLDHLNKKLVPTSPARKLLKLAERQMKEIPYLSGNIRVKIKGSALVPSYPQTGTFYLKKLEQRVAVSTVPTYLRMDFVDLKTLFPYTLWYQNYPSANWSSFPPEIKETLPPQTLRVLEWIASLFNGHFLSELDQWETEVEYERKSVWLTHKNRRAKISKEGHLEEVQMDGWSLKTKKLEQVGNGEFPSLIKISGEYKIEIEFFQLSGDFLEESLFQMGKKPTTQPR